MKIIYLHQYFRTKEQGGSLRSYFIAKALVQAGFEVDMITSHNQKVYSCQVIEGINVHYLPVFYDNKLGTLSRILSFFKFIWRCYFKARQIRKVQKKKKPAVPCICYATSTPLTIGLVALGLKRWQGLPYVFEVRDLWPQAPIEMGVIRGFWLKKFLFKLEKRIYHKAEKVVALSPGMQQAIEVKIPDKETLMIPNMSDCRFFAPTLPSSSVAPFIVSYTGTVGKANHLEYFIDIARLAHQQGLAQLRFWIVGEGKQLAHIRHQANNLPNVEFHKATSKAGIKQILARSQATYTSFLQTPVLATCSPNKFFDSLAAGRLTVVNTQGWLKNIVEENECGFYADPLQPREFLDKLLPFVQQPKLLQQYQHNASVTAQTCFAREKLTSEVVRLVKEVIDNQ